MSTEQSWTLGQLLDWTAKHLAQKSIDAPRLDAEVLLAHAVGCKRIDLYGTRFAEAATPEVRQKYRELIKRRLEGCPVAYLVGKKEFYGYEFAVGSAVLIPRPDTEVLVAEALAEAKKKSDARILDMGAGSGCVPIVLAKKLPNADVTAIDVSPDALAVARGNAEKHGAKVRFLEGDLFAPLAADDMFDIITSNPPYIAAEDLPTLPIGVRQYEPMLALDGGPGGFAIFDRLVDAARHRLRPGGTLLLEIGSPQETPARQKLSAFAEYELGPTVFDHSGHPRVLRAKRR
ncbi:MAG TPA: peptide chain release factor N(5)-glutamine methyltransferase [Gemmataceae bacterium]|nr:peptide chain release factor N(5)-glutamine methyltransferase [Gemmataceae bacterium]